VRPTGRDWGQQAIILGSADTLNLLPAFGTVLAMISLGEEFHVFHAAGFAAILLGVIVATRAATGPPVSKHSS
jgi:drug/metabolite transporter (DMT)-like permease